MIGVHVQIAVEIHNRTEQAFKILIVFLQQVIHLARADQNQLELQRNHFRKQCGGIDQTHFRIGGFHF